MNKAQSFSAPRSRTKHSTMPTAFQRPDRITQPLDVLVTVFNSARYRTRWKHYEDFVRMCDAAGSAVRLWTAEIAFGAREFAVTDPRNERHLQLRTDTELWHKERSLNLLLHRVIARHPHAEYFAFIDADVSFVRQDWADEARHALQHYDVVQMWREAYDLNAHGDLIQKHQSFACCYHEGVPYPVDDNYYYAPLGRGVVYYHPGYAWAWRRSALECVGGLIDWSIVGSADFHMAHGLVGSMEKTLKRKFAKGYARAFRAWEKRAEHCIKHNVGCMSGSLFHYWHGTKMSRAYKSRWKILEQTQFDHERDVVRDAQGLFRFQHHGTKRSDLLRDLVRDYFHARDEDAS
jgi:hypothetical protein